MTVKKRKQIIITAVLTVILCGLTGWIWWANGALEVNRYTVSSERLPRSFDGYKIAHISDLHNAELGKSNERLLNLIESTAPDIIAITGDLIDSRNTDIDIALEFAEGAVKIAPCYYVSGNHEARVKDYGRLKSGLTELGVTVLENQKYDLCINGETVCLIGVSDPEFVDSDTDSALGELTDGDDYTVLLSHRPELFELYTKYDVDLALSGHAHGGQFRLPFVGGMAAPNQGIFPKYDAGLYTEGSTNMIVSRGIGNSLFPFRINNRPEVILIELNLGE